MSLKHAFELSRNRDRRGSESSPLIGRGPDGDLPWADTSVGGCWDAWASCLRWSEQKIWGAGGEAGIVRGHLEDAQGVGGLSPPHRLLYRIHLMAGRVPQGADRAAVKGEMETVFLENLRHAAGVLAQVRGGNT